MALFITSLNSGSNGNCYYVGNHQEAVLIDAGLSCKETEKRMQLLGLSMQLVKAIFISHEHSDHIKGVEAIAEKYALPVFITAATAQRGRLHFNKQLLRHFVAQEPIMVGALSITAFPKLHDAADPHSFIVEGNGVTVGVLTDIGACCDQVSHYISKCHAAFLEANYDESLLEKGSYPIFLKERIRGGSGHLSNVQSLEIFTQYRPKFMTHLLLSHLSRDNNNPEMVQQLFQQQAKGVEVIVASRYEQTALYTIEAPAKAKPIKKKTKLDLPTSQLSLF